MQQPPLPPLQSLPRALAVVAALLAASVLPAAMSCAEAPRLKEGGARHVQAQPHPGEWRRPALPPDAATFLADVTIPDGTAMNAGQSFVKTWQLRNSGTVTWSGYQLAFVEGVPMGAPPSVSVPTTPPGATVDISIAMTAPMEVGRHFGGWRLLTSDGRDLHGVTVVIRVYAATPPAGEPRYAGRTFTEWEADLNAHSPHVRTKAVQALGNFGPRAVPALVKTFRADRDELVRSSALAALLDIRPMGGDAVRALLSAVTDPSPTINEIALMVTYAQQHSSGFIGQDAVPALVDALRSPNAATRRAAMTLLANLGPLARDAVPALRDLATRDPDPEVRDGANEVLKLIDSN